MEVKKNQILFPILSLPMKGTIAPKYKVKQPCNSPNPNHNCSSTLQKIERVRKKQIKISLFSRTYVMVLERENITQNESVMIYKFRSTEQKCIKIEVWTFKSIILL